jgi:hypothetical protein
LNVRIALQRLADFQSAFYWRFRAVGKDQRHPVTGREPNQFAGRFGFAKMPRFPDELIKLLEYLALIVDQKFREAHHVHEQDMGDFEMNFLFNLAGHPVKLRENKAIQYFRFPPTVERKAGVVETSSVATRVILEQKISHTYV